MLKVAALKRRQDFTLRAEFAAPTPGIVALFGRSGSGKTTMIDILSGLLAPDEGRIELEGTVLEDTRSGTSIPTEQRGIGYVFQDTRLFPHLSVLRNLQYGLKRAPAARHTIGLEQIVSMLGLQALLQRRPHQLSGGERQRVALGRALLSQPRLLLLDEPLASVDIARREEVLPYLELLRDRLSLPMVYVSHQFDEVLRLATHVVLMESGRVSAQGTPGAVSLSPELRAIVGADAVGAVVDGIVTRQGGAREMSEMRVGNGILHVNVGDAPVGARVRVQLLARDIILATEAPRALSVRNALEGRITELCEERPDTMLVKVDIGGAVVLSRVTQEAVRELALRAGIGVWVLAKAVSTRGHAFTVGRS